MPGNLECNACQSSGRCWVFMKALPLRANAKLSHATFVACAVCIMQKIVYNFYHLPLLVVITCRCYVQHFSCRGHLLLSCHG